MHRQTKREMLDDYSSIFRVTKFHLYYFGIGNGIELLFYLGKPLAMRLFHKAPRTVQTQAREKKRRKKKKRK